MPASEPSWWYGRDRSWQALLLSPVASLYGAIVARRIRKANLYRSRFPVICVGNFTAGGSGKTPLALLLAKLIAEEGREPWFLSRGYGGAVAGPVCVDAGRHTAREVGDEPLLLARKFPTVVARDRRKGAEAIGALASDNAVIIMDDGLQNPALAKDLSIAVVDARRGFGNGRVIPAGPLRAPLDVQAPLVQLIVLMGNIPPGSRATTLAGLSGVPTISAVTRTADDAERFQGRRVLAFAGIANPGRFFSMLDELGADIVAKHTFKDHHPFSDAEARELLDAADRSGASLVTTEKDFVRLSSSSGFCSELKKRSETLAIAAAIEGEDLDVLRKLLGDALVR